MSKPARGSLASLTVAKAVPAAATVPASPEPPVASREPARPDTPTPRRSPADMKTVQARISKQGWRALRDLASDLDVSLEALVVDALNDVLLKHQRPPIVQRRIGERGQERPE